MGCAGVLGVVVLLMIPSRPGSVVVPVRRGGGLARGTRGR